MNKIAFVSTNKSSWGGSEYLWYYTSLRFAEEGCDVSISIPRWKEIPDSIKEFDSKNVKVKYNTDISAIKKFYNRFAHSSIQMSYKDDGYKFLLSKRPDLVVINQGGNSGGIDLMEFCIRNDLRFITITQAANEAKWPSDKLNKRFSQAFPRAVANYFVSHANIRLTEIQIGQKVENSKIVFNPFNIEYDNEIEYPDDKNEFQIANVARHEFFAKGQDILFQVLNEKKWRERNLKFNLYGKGEHTFSIHKLKDFFKLDNVNLEGYTNPHEIWKQNHALILSSRYEGLPLALVEAMLCGRTGIVTNVSGNSEIMIDNVNGFLAKAPTIEFLDEAMERAWNRRNQWRDMGQRAKEHARKMIPKDPVKYFHDEILKLNLTKT